MFVGMMATVKTHCLFGSSGGLCLTRTQGLKVEPEEDVGNDGEEVTNNEDKKDAEDINDGQGRAVRGRAIKARQRYPYTSESITSGQSGDCPVYSQGFIYVWVAHRPWSVHTINKTLFLINEPYYQQ